MKEQKANSGKKTSYQQNWAWFWNRLEVYAAEKSLKSTKRRQLVIEHLLRAERHIDAEALYQQLRKKHRDIGQATVYRTLNLLKEAGLIEQLD